MHRQYKFLNILPFSSLVAVCIALVGSPVQAQYGEEWSVAQAYLEGGMLHYDFNHDGRVELTKHYLNTITVYSGADSFLVIWSLTVPQREQLRLWNEYQIGNNRSNVCVFFTSNLTDSNRTEVIAFPTLGANALWRTGLQAGYQSYLDTANLDDDATTEIVYGLNQWDSDQSRYYSRFYVLNSSNGAAEYTSERYEGFMIGPYLGDLDGDGTVEILLNIYNDADTTSSLKSISFGGNGVTHKNPGAVISSLLGSAYPNPFNSQTTVPLSLNRASDVRARVFDLQGRTVAFIIDGRLAAGQYSFAWNGLDSDGRPLPTGQYFCEFQVGQTRFTKPLTLLR